MTAARTPAPLSPLNSGTAGSAPDRRTLDRRTLMVRGLQLGGVLAAGPLLAACGSSSSTLPTATGGSKDFGTVGVRLSWIKNVEFAGAFVADQKGYFKAAGFTGPANLIAGGPTATPIESDVLSGTALVGISSPDITAAAIAQGAPLKIIGAEYQKNPFCIMSLAAKPISKPQDMYGKTIGVQSTNESVWAAFLKANSLDESKIHKVPVQFDPLGLTTGEVDGWFSFVTNEPIELTAKGFKTTTMLFADNGYPLVSEVYVVTQDSIDNNRDKLKAFLAAQAKGWKDAIADPALPAGYAVNVYGKDLGLNLASQTAQSTAQNALVANADTKANGLFTVSDKLLGQSMSTLALGGSTVTAKQLFDLSLLTELYAGDASLK